MNQRAEYAKHHQPAKTYREGLPPMPERMKLLRVDARGYPVPWFVGWVDGKPDFRVVREYGIPTAYQKKLCWLCGGPMGVNKAFVIGPMCAVNKVTSEPPSHLDCAEFAVQACPFMLLPNAKRRDANLPADVREPPGQHNTRNPGAFVIWVTTTYRPFKAQNGYLFELGAPNKEPVKLQEGDSRLGPVEYNYEVFWWSEGKRATRKVAYEALRGGMPFLVEAAVKDGEFAVKMLMRSYGAALSLLPAGDPVQFLDFDRPEDAAGAQPAVAGTPPSGP